MMPMPVNRRQPASPETGPAPAGPPDIGALMGAEDEGAIPQPSEMKQEFQQMIRGLSGQVSQLAQQYPAFGPFAEQIAKLAQDGLMAVLAQLGQQEPEVNPMAL